ncbi:MAG: C10 family peptidase, partial [Fibromonadaceae bacterium]|nr:C10 family peptidase [Fibromonadaceae bacterium]
ETDNPGVKIFLERLEYYILGSIVDAERQKDSLLNDILKKLDIKSNELAGLSFFESIDNGTRNIDSQTVLRIDPIVPVQWRQGTPFNNNLTNPNCSDGKNSAGCVAVAVAQILYYWNYPTVTTNVINGSFIYWPWIHGFRRASNFRVNRHDTQNDIRMKDRARVQVANLFQKIGAGVNMNYGCLGSSASMANALSFLRNHGFTVPALSNYNLSIVTTSLVNNKRPIIAVGCSAESTGKKCHAWVIDGYHRIRVITTLAPGLSIPLYDNHYVHNNWGWNGSFDGFYLNNVFNPSELAFQNIEVAPVYR